MTLLLVLVAWFAAGVLATLVLGPRLRRAAELAGVALEPEPVFLANRSPLRWRVGTLGVVGLLAGSTGMAAAGALPGSAQTIAHHVLSTVGVHVPEAPPAAEVVAAPTATPWADVGTGATPPGTATATGPGFGPATGAGPSGTSAPEAAASGGGDVVTTPSTRGTVGGSTAETAPVVERPEPSDVDDTAAVPRDEPSDVPSDPVVEEPTTTTTTPPEEETPPTTEPPPEEQPEASGDTTTTTTLVPPDPGTPPPPAG